MFDALGFLALGELPFPVTPVIPVVANPGSAYRYLRDAGKLEHWRRVTPTKQEQLAADRLGYLEKARQTILQNKADAIRQDETRMENLGLANIARLQNIEKVKQQNELRAENLEKARMAIEQSRRFGVPPANTFHSVVQDSLDEKRRDEIAAKRLESLEKARGAAKEKKERERQIKEQRLKNLAKGRKKK